jgi:RNA-directed DNA polymerase
MYPHKKHIKYFLDSIGKSELALSLLANENDLEQHIKFPDYQLFHIPKKSGGYRKIMEPESQLKELQRNVSAILQELVEVNMSAHGFVKTMYHEPRHIKSNASKHMGKKWVYNIDIKDFFGSINAVRVKQVFTQKPFNFSEEKSKYLALLLVYQQQLPAGAPSSPIISNMVCEALDNAFNQWVAYMNDLEADAQWCYTRYADDITFSTHTSILPMHLKEINKILLDFGFERNEKKDRLFSHLQAQWVTGIKVNTKPNLDRKYIRKLRAILHNCRAYGLTVAANKFLFETNDLLASKEDTERFKRILKGKIDHVGFVRGKDDGIYLNLKNQWLAL